MCSLVMYTAGNATIRRQFGPPHFFDIGVDAKIKQAITHVFTNNWRYTPQGYGRFIAVGLPTYLTFVGLEHFQERRRLRQYCAQNTVFGEQARRLVQTGKIEEFLPVNINASVNKSERNLFA
ncbi:hypothetical protein STCU_03038 [Strigomonas culicis]|nr:hypothetical protein STCU_03038 [Strigomonas culicis]|eukprot:EPY31985.1 hypothetical protein STCU_03038 [Strigomonas culicis]